MGLYDLLQNGPGPGYDDDPYGGGEMPGPSGPTPPPQATPPPAGGGPATAPAGPQAGVPDFGTLTYGGYGVAAPQFAPPPAFDAPEFYGPDAYNDPSFQFRIDAGREARERTAAARGLLNSGGFVRELEDYAQDYASTEYGNMWDRAVQDYQRRFGADLAEYNSAYGTSKDLWESQYMPWQHNSSQSMEAWQAMLQAILGAAGMYGD